MAETIDLEQLVEVAVEKIVGEEEEAQESSATFNMNTYTTNYTERHIQFRAARYWRGRADTNNPHLPPGQYAPTRQIGPLPEGVKFGLMYSDGTARTDRQFIVAFDNPNGKVYAESGPMFPINWDIIELKLSMSGNKMDFTDPFFGGRCVARLSDNGDGFATFYST